MFLYIIFNYKLYIKLSKSVYTIMNYNLLRNIHEMYNSVNYKLLNGFFSIGNISY